MGSLGSEADPSAFTQAPEHRPNPTSTAAADGIPLIDLSPLLQSSSTAIPSSLVDVVAAACRDWGFFQVINHGVPRSLLANLHSHARAFFALPADEKRLVSRNPLNPLGYYDTEHTKNVRDWKEVFDFMVHDNSTDQKLILRNQWPRSPPGLRGACEEYANAVEGLAFKLLEVIAVSLGLPARRLEGFFREGGNRNSVRVNHYPACPFPELALGVGRHKDPGALTVLWQDEVGGLEVKRRSDGEWVKVEPIADSFIINVGDIIQVWSNDKYESAEHRVAVNSKRDRFSIPLILYPGQDAMVAPLEEVLVAEGQPAHYEAYNWGDFFRTRKESNFKKLAAENIQIYHFRKTN